jgi:hypothetical protein
MCKRKDVSSRLSLIILYFSYTSRYDCRRRDVSCVSQGVHMSGRYTLNGRHFLKSVPEMGEVLPKQGEK